MTWYGRTLGEEREDYDTNLESDGRPDPVDEKVLSEAMWAAVLPITRLPRSQTIHLRAANEAEPEGIEGTGEYGDE